jgi:hypothetical protein
MASTIVVTAAAAVASRRGRSRRATRRRLLYRLWLVGDGDDEREWVGGVQVVVARLLWRPAVPTKTSNCGVRHRNRRAYPRSHDEGASLVVGALARTAADPPPPPAAIHAGAAAAAADIARRRREGRRSRSTRTSPAAALIEKPPSPFGSTGPPIDNAPPVCVFREGKRVGGCDERRQNWSNKKKSRHGRWHTHLFTHASKLKDRRPIRCEIYELAIGPKPNTKE